MSNPIGYEVGNPVKVAGQCMLCFPYLEKSISEMFRISGGYGAMKSLTKKGNEWCRERMINSLFGGLWCLMSLVKPVLKRRQSRIVERRWNLESDKPCFRSAIISFMTMDKLF